MAINLDLIAQQKERDMLRAFADAISDIKNNAVLKDLERAIELQDDDAVIRILGLDRAAFERIDDEIYQAYRRGGLTGVEQIGRIPTELGSVALRFDMAAPTAVEWVRNRSSEFITGDLVEDQRQMVRNHLATGLEAGNNPRTTAIDLIGRYNPQTKSRTGGMLGLTDRQADWVRNARSELESLNGNYLSRSLRDTSYDNLVRKAIEDGKPLTKAQIDNAITRMQSKTLRYRGEVIARTESINALRAGQFESVQQAIQVGELDQQDVKKAWDATFDGRTREDHQFMELTYKEGIPIDQPYVFPDLQKSEAMFPGDTSLDAPADQIIQCRCRNVITIDFIGRQVRMEGFK